MLIGLTVMADVFYNVTMLSGRMLPSSRILNRRRWRQQFHPQKLVTVSSFYPVVRPREDGSYDGSHLIY